MACTLAVQAQRPATRTASPTAKSTATTPWPDAVAQRLDALMADSLLETAQLGMMVWDLTTDQPLYQRNHRQLMRTASTMKAFTAIAALDRLGGDYRVRTSLYYTGEITDSVFSGQLYCQGGMDPLFSQADIEAFAHSVRQMGVKAAAIDIVLDNSMKDTLRWGEGWCWDDNNPTLTPLLYNGRDTFKDHLVMALQADSIDLITVTLLRDTVPQDAQLLCQRTHTIDELLQPMMKDSHNLTAECLYYQLAAATGRHPATAADAQRVEQELLKKMGLDGGAYRLADGSGLSLYNYLSPECLTLLMRYAFQHPDIYRHLLPSLPVAGKDGTLEKRMRRTPAQGRVQAKTGTVAAVSTLTGYITAPNGHRLCFAIMMQGLRRVVDGRRLQDALCVALCQ